MALAGITQQSVIEAGIAADLAANPQLLPEPSIWFQDFNFGQTMWDAAYGNVDGGSVSGVGEAVADIAIENVLELARKEREENNPAKDAGMIVELAENQRREQARYVNGQFHIDGMVLSHAQLREAISNTRDRLPQIARDNNWTEEETREAEGMLDDLEEAEQHDPERVPQILDRIGRENPVLRQEISTDIRQLDQKIDQTAHASDDIRGADVAEINDEEIRVETTVEIATELGYEEPQAAIELTENAELARADVSIGDNPFSDTRSSAESFNPAARGETGDTELGVTIQPQPIAQTQTMEI